MLDFYKVTKKEPYVERAKEKTTGRIARAKTLNLHITPVGCMVQPTAAQVYAEVCVSLHMIN
jgi:hypothetical protein